MSIEFNNGFFVFDKSWIHENQFVQSLSHAEYRILIYLLSSRLKISGKGNNYERGKLIASLYQKNRILFANVSQRTIAEKCSANRGTVYRTLNKFNDFGSVIKISDNGENGANHYYIIGFEKDKEGKQDYHLVDSIPLRSGQRLPDGMRDYIINRYQDTNFCKSDVIWRDLFGMEKDNRLRICG